MTAFGLSLIFLLSASQPATDATAQPSTPAATQPATEEPKMVCKYEHVTGSRLQKTKICRPENEANADNTALQRKMDRLGDHRVAGGSTDVIGGGAGIGN